jgi:hypothetical protein
MKRARLPPERYTDTRTPPKPRKKTPSATASDPPAAHQQKRARLPPGRYADTQDGARGEEEEEADRTAELKKMKGGKGYSSQFVGVSWVKVKNMWRADRKINGKCTYLGYYAKEEDAARAYLEHGTRNGVNEQGTLLRKKAGPASRFRGVSWHKASGRWRSELAGGYLGYFRDENDAARSYNDEVRRLGLPVDRLNTINTDEDAAAADDDGDENYRGDHDDTGGASMHSGATGTAAAPVAAAAPPAAAAAAAAAAAKQRPKPAAPIAPIARSTTELADDAARAHIKALEAKAAAKEAAAELEDAKAALAAKLFERSS